ncbi:DEAD/DEAH box helicase [Rugamonas sp. FT82W]|uniref:DEAD/DEAH box helicase n=1 Tax=Duganella vulcania TaxID=2692166 RepID=A0A845G7V2_9BURK|nr:DEAD/DEAH box helicase [Duganella vulcania]MYM88929.1 DEAD/DEAH box helicase [Duganella vulcania]
MKLEHQSRNLLAATKSKAKLNEFLVPKEFHFPLADPLQDLLILSVGILGQLSAKELTTSISWDSGVNDEIDSLKRQLILVAEYFDALDSSGEEDEISDYLTLLGAAAYYLGEMPGSSSVLAKRLDSKELYGFTDSYIESALIYVLKGDYSERDYVPCEYAVVNNVVNAYCDFLKQIVDADSVVDFCDVARSEIYDLGTDRELFLGDILVALVHRKIKNSAINCLPVFTDLPLENWSNILKKAGFIQEFWPAQVLLGKEGVFTGRSSVIQMPTSAGKTKSAEIIARSAFLSGRANLAVVVAPFRALCRELSDSFQSAFSNENVTINELLDVPQVSDDDAEFMRFLLGEKFRDPKSHKSILIATPEKLVYLLRHQPEIAQKIGLLILDEGHQFDTGGRGVTFELLVASLLAAVPKDSQKILISAVIANGKTIGEWLYGESGVAVYGSHCLPTNRSVAFASWTEEFGQLNYLDSESISEREFIVPRMIEQINLGRRGREESDRVFPDPDKPTTIPSYLGIKMSHLGAVAIFCGTKLIVNAVCNNILRAYDRGLTLPPPSDSSNLPEINKLKRLSELHFGAEETITRSIALGVLPHSAGTPNGLRVSIEWAVANGRASLVVCTSTLSQGVNLPIKYLVIASTKQATEEIRKRDFHNLMGRAGRSGYHTEGSVIFSNVKLYQDRFKFRGKRDWKDTLDLLDVKNSDDCVSSLKDILLPCPVVNFNWNLLSFIAEPAAVRMIARESLATQPKELAVLLEFTAFIDEIIQKIESFMLSFYKDNPEFGDVVVFGELAKRTLAYHMAGDDERLELIEVFRAIGESILSLPVEKIAYYGKALLGIAQLKEIEDWINERRFELAICDSDVDLFKVCWPLLLSMSRSEVFSKLQPVDSMRTCGLAWITGSSYKEILTLFESSGAVVKTEKRSTKVSMLNVVDFTDSGLAYDSMLIVGAIADIVEATFENEELSKKLRTLQASLRIGLGSEFQKLAYARGYADRELCKAIEMHYEEHGGVPNNFDVGFFRRDRPFLSSMLEEFPTYFSKVSL